MNRRFARRGGRCATRNPFVRGGLRPRWRGKEIFCCKDANHGAARRAGRTPHIDRKGLAENGRLKIPISLLQEAAAQVSHPRPPAPPMEREPRAVGLTDSILWVDRLGAPIDVDAFVAPGAERLATGIAGDLSAMMEPVAALASPPGRHKSFALDRRRSRSARTCRPFARTCRTPPRPVNPAFVHSSIWAEP